MSKTVDKIKWLSSSLVVIALLLVFWVWPAWNSGPQTWYWGNDGDTISKMYRNRHAPSGHNDDFSIGSNMTFVQDFMADEPANQMLAFDNSPWQYHIEWYPGMGMAIDAETMVSMADLEWSLSIGRWSSDMNMMMTWTPFFTAMGSSMLNGGSHDNPVVIEGSTMSMMSQFSFLPGDILGAMVMIMNHTGRQITFPLARTCYFTSPLSDPGYPGFLGSLPVPTLSQWGMLVLAVLVAFLSVTAIRRRPRTGKS